MGDRPGMNRRHFLKHVAGFSLMALPAYHFLETIRANAQTASHTAAEARTMRGPDLLRAHR